MSEFKKPATPGYIYEDPSKMTDSDRTYIYPMSAISQIIPDDSLYPWAVSTSYKVGDRCYYTDGCAYECTKDHTSSSTFDFGYWAKISLQTDLDALNKKFNYRTVCFTANNWSGDSAPYTQSITVSGFTGSEDEHPIVSLNYPSSIVSSTAEDYEEAFSYISIIETTSDGLKATCMHDKPTYDVYINIMG